ncbi:predicted protein [Nematostella vectensis]|uniref:Uncharacterized protein n=1 Tax=Nematostella vectensis TaxID=45351 RepID=A7SJD5_NEMVE|nr:uncharacterized protein LOC5507650 [Nematostella vectensis]EDO36202.1 predicted protein [Nematostella vectensis]|eukprot:XP_001628265.1 predicted protein [Nematostella vectensis]
MVKPELKSEVLKPPLLPPTSGDSEIDLEGNKVAKEDSEVGLVVHFDTERSAKTPRICLFAGLFVFILLVGFLAVYLIGRTHGNSPEARQANMADDMAVVPEREANTSSMWKQNVSWETKEELFQLSDAIGNSDNIISLRPIYRKDLPPAYIAYWELKLHGKTGERYVIISAAKETGDHRLAEEGPVPSPIDLMADQAERLGYRCHRVYRLTPTGLMVCEDRNLKRLVSATNDIVNTNSMFYSVKWRALDKQVANALTGYRKDWRELANRVKKLPEWNRFKWLSMKSGKWPVPEPTRISSESYEEKHTHENGEDADKPKGKWHRNRSRNKHKQHREDDNEEEETELGLRPGEIVRLPIGRHLNEVYIRFSGFSKMSRHPSRKSTSRWQRRLCRVLCDACEGSDYTRVKRKYVKKTRLGDRYIKLRIESDSRFVRKQLQGQEIRFRIEVMTGRLKIVVVNYGIVLKSSRHPRSVATELYKIPRPELFPDFQHFSRGTCAAGCGAAAWAMILGYYGNMGEQMAGTTHRQSPPNSTTLSPMAKRTFLLVERITRKLNPNCSTSTEAVRRIGQSIQDISHTALTLITENDHGNTETATSTSLQLLKSGVPVVMSKERGDSGEHQYAVATQLRERQRQYRVCGTECSEWREETTSEVCVHSSGTGTQACKWESADTHFAGALVKKGT